MASDQIVFFTRSGYEYRHRIQMDEQLLRSYQEHILCSSVALIERSVIFELRTNFTSKPRVVDAAVDSITDSENFAGVLRGGEEVMESERFANISAIRYLVERVLLGHIWCRISEYWLPEERIQRIADEALDFVNRMAFDPQYDYLAVIPLVLGIDVCTVQLQGESIDATIRRSIKPDCLFPIPLWGNMIIVPGMSKEEMAMCPLERVHLMGLPMERVEEDVSIASACIMKSCPICSEAPAYGTLLTRLTCDHVFHNHCIVRVNT